MVEIGFGPQCSTLYHAWSFPFLCVVTLTSSNHRQIIFVSFPFTRLLFGGCTLLALPVLIPLNMVDGINQGGLASMNIGNINQAWRLWFHLALTYIFCSEYLIPMPALELLCPPGLIK